MKFRPILFSTEMVKAILEGRKTMTRRILKLKHMDIAYVGAIHPDGSGKGWVAWAPGKGVTAEHTKQAYPGNQGFVCPHGAVGDVLWVREEHYRYGQWKKNGLTKTGRQRWRFYPDSQFKEIRYFDNPPATVEKNSHRDVGWYKRLARFMPKSACRIFLKIEDIRVERLQDISEADAIAEGILRTDPIDGVTFFKNYSALSEPFLLGSDYGFDDGKEIHSAPKASYCTLWTEINGRELWIANPWVWCLTFTRIDKPENF